MRRNHVFLIFAISADWKSHKTKPFLFSNSRPIFDILKHEIEINLQPKSKEWKKLMGGRKQKKGWYLNDCLQILLQISSEFLQINFYSKWNHHKTYGFLMISKGDRSYLIYLNLRRKLIYLIYVENLEITLYQMFKNISNLKYQSRERCFQNYLTKLA